MRFACDTGGTFTDLTIEDENGDLHMYKSPTTPDDPIRGVIDTMQKAATEFGLNLSELMAKGETFIHGTTHAINAIITGNTAKTAFITTAGHPDILFLREGGRSEPFNHTVPYPDPYISRSLTFEAPGRINYAGKIVIPLDEEAVVGIINDCLNRGVESFAVCLLWSIVNPEHELRVGELLEASVPHLPFTLSHKLNPALREYRRASSTAIDASLKPS